ncbi:ATP-binding protein [Alkalihalobacillus sp. MEB130]|uniref:ATP-binding protein n=1 Tax=Alkalihalobacillus sp. MEB130 TaxID=2976704 RepID=UPI0028E090D1|nr:ATP-binding protein [Alkalihalobacillus sp. MEB130]MDT8860275.1 ATP-binding protein [Alkalihalobacillus sp. MEB130]
MINDTKKDDRASVFDAIYEAKIGSYLGMPVYLSNGKLFGTVCAIDPEPYAFTEQEIETIKRLSSVVSVIIENAGKSSYDEFDDKLMRLEKLSLLGQLSAGLAHELRNPMQSVRGFVQFLFEDQKHNHFRDIVLSEIDRMNQLINDFLMATQPTAPKRDYYNINDLVSGTVEFMKNEATLHNVDVSLSFEVEKAIVHVDKSQITQVLINLMKNAFEAAGAEYGKVKVAVNIQEQQEVVIEIVDNGPGIPVSIIGRIGEPFFSTKDEGTGLGLSISQRIIQEHNGAIRFENLADGTKVSVKLPLVVEKRA